MEPSGSGRAPEASENDAFGGVDERHSRQESSRLREFSSYRLADAMLVAILSLCPS